MKQCVRIIGGMYRGKKLSFPSEAGLRPTPDRVRETLFNWLMHDIRGARCLDAFAGSGALGFEAYSRGAEHVVLLEKNPTVYRQLCMHVHSFDATKMTVKQQDASIYLKQSKASFDIVFLDPPFKSDYLPLCITHLAHQDTLIPGGLLYVEGPSLLSLNEHDWQLLKQKKAGQVTYCLYQKVRAYVNPGTLR